MDDDNPNEKSTASSPSSPPSKPTKPPRPPPPNIKRPTSIAQHLDALQGLRPERIRWFYKEDKRSWTPFCGGDSLAIEQCFRRIRDFEKSSEKSDPDKPLNTTALYDLPIVMGGLFEVDVVARLCAPIYWKDTALPVCRGMWFIGAPNSPDLWQPVSEEDADQIENSHQSIWRAMGLGHVEEDDKPQSSALGRLNLKGYYVEWNDITDVWLYWDDIKSRIIRGVGTKIGLSSAASPLHRGYHTDALAQDQPCNITHLVFVVHGIGQLLHMSNIVKNANGLRTCIGKVIDKKILGISANQRVEFLPVEWRTSLKLDEGTIECVTPKTVTGIRNILNSSMMDILYYTSPFYRYEIINGVRDELNRLYDAFCARNQYFVENHGKVSIVAHSLGSVITYDILSLWDIEERHLSEQDLPTTTGFLTESFTYLRNLASKEQLETASGEELVSGSSGKKEQTKPKENIRVELAKARNTVMELEALLKCRLELETSENSESEETDCPYALRFKIETLFNIGSPLAVFLALRGIRPQDDVEDHVLPKSVCKRMFNIYHPADPVAYRIEPLISEDYSSIPPIQLHRFDQTKVGYVDEKKPPEKGGWSLFSYRVSKPKENSEETRSRSASTSDSDAQDELVIVDHAVDLADQEKTDGADKERAAPEKKGGWMSSWFGAPRKQGKTNDQPDGGTQPGGAEGSSEESPKQKKKCEHVIVPSKVLDHRMDFVLKEGYMESNYISAVTSHISYWGSCDVARFILENTLDFEQSSVAEGPST